MSTLMPCSQKYPYSVQVSSSCAISRCRDRSFVVSRAQVNYIAQLATVLLKEASCSSVNPFLPLMSTSAPWSKWKSRYIEMSRCKHRTRRRGVVMVAFTHVDILYPTIAASRKPQKAARGNIAINMIDVAEEGYGTANKISDGLDLIKRSSSFHQTGH
ncbi:hypothetical protein B0F90DRAFT_1823430 [Multifurca ochricompacta]|uniref:Uncharacterized protein n=1 Tax=Multifurca ochricompacta TaxID=376703 RepID=A0AAD4LXA7_9AGAM|nr:hypothetical protein B0F90DRAFT_1823430 [Multifurca ochricompacta]